MKTMKAELATTIVAAIAGALIAYFVANLFIGEIKSVGVKTVETEVTADLAEPDANIFNQRALNPTVEIYIGGDDLQTTVDNFTSSDDTTNTDTTNAEATDADAAEQENP